LVDRTVVYLANPKESGTFVQREVRLGQSSGEQVEVLSGVQPGDVVVIAGSFFVRAERERLRIRPAASPANANATSSPSSDGRSSEAAQTAKVVVSEHGYEPAKLTLSAGTPARITFVRTTDKTCLTEVVFHV